MTIWMCRAGLKGQYLNDFIKQKKIFLVGSVGMDLTGKTDMQELMKAMAKDHPSEPDGSITTMSVQARAFATKAKAGDIVVVPEFRGDRFLYVAEITGAYEYNGRKGDLRHSHDITWKHGVWERDSFTDAALRSIDAFDSFMLFYKLNVNVERQIIESMSKGKPFAEIGDKKIESRRSVNKPENEPLEESEPFDDSEIKEVISEVRETITYVKKETLAESAEVKKVIAEVKDVLDDVRMMIEAGIKCECDCNGGNKTVYCECDRWYYETPRERRRFRF